jgi:hypothetical protein
VSVFSKRWAGCGPAHLVVFPEVLAGSTPGLDLDLPHLAFGNALARQHVLTDVTIVTRISKISSSPSVMLSLASMCLPM